MVRVRKHTRLPLVTYLRGGPPSIWKLTFPKEVRPGRDSAEVTRSRDSAEEVEVANSKN